MDLASQNWKTYRDTPKVSPDRESMDMTEDVLIDVDGRRKTFRIGFYNTDGNGWQLYDTEEEIELEHMKWTELPHDSKSWDDLMPLVSEFSNLSFEDDELKTKHDDLITVISEKILEYDLYGAFEKLEGAMEWYESLYN